MLVYGTPELSYDTFFYWVVMSLCLLLIVIVCNAISGHDFQLFMYMRTACRVLVLESKTLCSYELFSSCFLNNPDLADPKLQQLWCNFKRGLKVQGIQPEAHFRYCEPSVRPSLISRQRVICRGTHVQKLVKVIEGQVNSATEEGRCKPDS